ncbi:chalcone isomerase family protein [Deferribacter thermophilus]|uniref:chalcone isomerase family protein n=1 Tax=Deferribacter thermophilus TaxID=53573 RepID=UPI003C133824
MKKISLILALLLVLIIPTGYSKVIKGVNIPGNYQYFGKNLVLNGTGFRKKFFIKVYIGALYLEQKTNDEKIVISAPTKVVKMHFLYKKVKSSQMKDTFKEGFEKINENLLKESAVQEFLNSVSFDVVKGDEVDLIIDKDMVTVLKNGNKIGDFKSQALADALIKIYVGEEPADSGLKEGLLGKE